MKNRLCSALFLAALTTAGCDSQDPSEASSSTGDPVEHALTATIKLEADADGEHVNFSSQNGSKVAVAIKDLVGKKVYWATTPVGEPAGNAMPIEILISTMDADLTTSITTGERYAEGPWELACVISVTDSPPPNIPAAGDLAAFDNAPTPAGEPPPTGVSVRVHVTDADDEVTLTNDNFIRFGQ